MSKVEIQNTAVCELQGGYGPARLEATGGRTCLFHHAVFRASQRGLFLSQKSMHIQQLYFKPKNSELIRKHSTLVGVYPHPWTFRKYTTPMVFREFLKNPTYPKIWGLSAYPLLTISNLTTGIIIFDILSPRAFRKYT